MKRDCPAVVALGLATLSQYIFNWQLGIDELLFRDTADAYNLIRGRMSPASAFIFVMVGLALTALPSRALRTVVLLASTVIIGAGAMICVGYLWNANELITDSWLPPVALNTSLAFALLGVGIFFAGWERGHATDTRAEKKALAGFGIALALLIISGGYAYRASAKHEQSVEWINRTQNVRIQLAQLYNRIADIESAQRFYLLTGKPSYRDEYRRLVAELGKDKPSLDRLLAGNPAQIAHAADLWPLINHRIDLTDRQLSIFDNQGEAAAKAAIAAGNGMQTMRHIRALIQRMSGLEVDLLGKRQAELEHNRKLTLLGFLAMLLIAAGIFVTLFIEIQREMVIKSRMRAQLQETATRIATILDTVADGIITTDDLGVIESFNRAAEQLFGYAAIEIIGHNISTLMPEPTRSHHDGYLKHYAMTGKKRVIGTGREVLALRKDGSTFDMSLQVGEMLLAGQRHYTGIASDITARKKIEHNLVTSKEQAELANRAKDSFLATMSHEIRTPLTGLLGMMELLSMTRLDGEQINTLNAAWNSAKGLLRIVNDILDWSKIEEGKLQLAPQATSIPQLLQDVINTYARVASAKGLILKQCADPAISRFHIVDPLRLSQVLNNFVSNAIKFTSNGSIDLRAELLDTIDGGERICFSVIDTGIGIEEEVQASLFERYRQVGADTARLYGGTGLGLAICRRLAELMDGQVELKSRVGHGSTFTIMLTLPVCNEPIPELQAGNAEANITSIKFLAERNGKVPTVLAVDDHPINRNLLASQLKILGLQVETAENGREALSKWRDGHFALVITDCHMPEMDGYTLAQEIRKAESEQYRARTPIVAWTANALAEESTRCQATGMDEVLIKPANLKQLANLLAKCIPHNMADGNKPAPTPRATHIDQAGTPIDYAVLRQIIPDSAAQLDALRSFRSHLRTDHAKLHHILEKNDLADLKSMAHRMKGSCLMVGASHLATCFAEMERIASENELTKMGNAKAALEIAAMQLENYFIDIGISEK
ncbi:MAG: CHASE3 domain-containing protein [Burkholderiales bacterium]